MLSTCSVDCVCYTAADFKRNKHDEETKEPTTVRASERASGQVCLCFNEWHERHERIKLDAVAVIALNKAVS